MVDVNMQKKELANLKIIGQFILHSKQSKKNEENETTSEAYQNTHKKSPRRREEERGRMNI